MQGDLLECTCYMQLKVQFPNMKVLHAHPSIRIVIQYMEVTVLQNGQLGIRIEQKKPVTLKRKLMTELEILI